MQTLVDLQKSMHKRYLRYLSLAVMTADILTNVPVLGAQSTGAVSVLLAK